MPSGTGLVSCCWVSTVLSPLACCRSRLRVLPKLDKLILWGKFQDVALALEPLAKSGAQSESPSLLSFNPIQQPFQVGIIPTVRKRNWNPRGSCG